MAGYESQLQYQDPHAFGRSLYGVHSPASGAPPHGSTLPPAAAAAFYGSAAAAAAAADFGGCWSGHPAAAAAAAAAYSAAGLSGRCASGGGVSSVGGGSGGGYAGFHQGGYEAPAARLGPGHAGCVQGSLASVSGSRHHHHHPHHQLGGGYETAALTSSVGGGSSGGGGGGGGGSKKKPPHVKKPLNAFMLFMKEMRAKVVAECTLKESAAINQILGRKWHALSREEQAKYYELARKEKELHMQLYPGWTARDNYAVQVATKKKASKKRRPTSGELLLQQHHQQQQQLQQQQLQHHHQELEVGKKATSGQQAAAAAFGDGGYQSYMVSHKPDYRVASDPRSPQFDDYPGLQQPQEGVVTFTELT